MLISQCGVNTALLDLWLCVYGCIESVHCIVLFNLLFRFAPVCAYSKRRPNAFIPIIIMSWYQIRLLLPSFVCFAAHFFSLSVLSHSLTVSPTSAHFASIAFSGPESHDDNTQWHHLTAKPTYSTALLNKCAGVCSSTTTKFIFGSSKTETT